MMVVRRYVEITVAATCKRPRNIFPWHVLWRRDLEKTARPDKSVGYGREKRKKSLGRAGQSRVRRGKARRGKEKRICSRVSSG